MPYEVKEEGRKYTRLKHTKDEEITLRTKGLIPVVSSNVSGIARNENVLVVRFHGGATYGYPSSGELFNEMLKSPSKGKFVWRELRRKRVPYYRMGAVNLLDDVESKDMMHPTLETQVFIDTMIAIPDIMTMDLIVGLTLASVILNDGRQAENGR